MRVVSKKVEALRDAAAAAERTLMSVKNGARFSPAALQMAIDRLATALGKFEERDAA